MLAADPGQRPTVLVMFATLSVRPPTPTSVGKVRNVPPPAMELTAAARKATAVMSSRCMEVGAYRRRRGKGSAVQAGEEGGAVFFVHARRPQVLRLGDGQFVAAGA